jgi:hypothetical protein
MRSLAVFFLASGLALGLLAAGSTAPRAADNKAAKPGGGDPVKFDTADQVQLQGTYYAPPGGGNKKAPCALLLHKIESGDSSKDGWDQLARDLQKAGYAVLTFDFRGHGNSTSVGPGFWGDQSTTLLAALTNFNRSSCKERINPKQPKETIGIKDFNKGYWITLVNDVQAAKLFLDRKNDSGECNSANLTLIGAEDGASIGALWLYADLNLWRVTMSDYLGHPIRLAQNPEGKDVAACVWLSISPKIGSTGGSVQRLLEYAGKERKIPMAFVCGEKNKQDPVARFTESCYNAVKPAKDSKAAKLTGEMLIKDSSLAGSALLGDQVKVDGKTTTREWIVDKYLKAVRGETVAPPWEEREIEKTAFAWTLPGTRVPLPAKQAMDKSLGPVPLTFFRY